jgi:cytochrome c
MFTAIKESAMKRIILLSTASIIGLISTAASAQLYYFDIHRAMETAGQKVFADHCVVCHAQKAGARSLAPSLRGVVGRQAASVAGFPYSDALKKSGLTWTEDNLRNWIADPSHTVPGTLMPHVTLSDPAEQLYVIAYLKTLKPQAAR